MQKSAILPLLHLGVLFLTGYRLMSTVCYRCGNCQKPGKRNNLDGTLIVALVLVYLFKQSFKCIHLMIPNWYEMLKRRDWWKARKKGARWTRKMWLTTAPPPPPSIVYTATVARLVKDVSLGLSNRCTFMCRFQTWFSIHIVEYLPHTWHIQS